MDEGKKIWIPDIDEGYILAIIKDIKSDVITAELIIPADSKSPTKSQLLQFPYSQVFPSEQYDDKDFDDNCALMYLNDATLLNNLRVRYKRNVIYTYVANILIAINPYMDMTNLYNHETIVSYKGKSLGTMPPHIYAIADKAYRDMKFLKENQSIIVSGESGAGKTESTKYILKYLTDNWGSSAGPIEQRIVECNPLLEAFGNAKTTRNNNSSRFGKFVEIHFDSKLQVCGGFISHYLLEKSRICLQSENERNYQIFYRLCAGANNDLREKLSLSSPDNFHFLNRGCTQYFCNPENESKINDLMKSALQMKNGSLKDITIDDVRDFYLTDTAMTHMGLSDESKLEIYKVVAAILHLGNVAFEDLSDMDTSGGCQIMKESFVSLELASKMLGCNLEKISLSLTSRLILTSHGGRRGSAIHVPLKTAEAQNARDALAKAIYVRLFDYIVATVNSSLPLLNSNYYIGLLDIAGFEYFQINSFEQFCINYCNEKLQQFFNERILKEEQALYEKEDLKVKKIHYIDNQDCIDLIEMKPFGIFSILDEESKLPKPMPEHFTTEVHMKNKDHYRLDIPRKSKWKLHREIRDEEGFLIKHYAGAVVYHTALFVDKNNDALHYSLESLILNSTNGFIKLIFDGCTDSSISSSGKLNFISVGSKFQMQLNQLIDKLRSTGTNFIRCIKPNSKMKGHLFEGSQILMQLQYSGMPSILDLMHQGFPSRTQFAELYARYKHFMPDNIARLDPRLFCRALFKALGLNDKDYKFGMTKIFFRPGKFAEFDQLLTTDPENLALLISKVQHWLIGMIWRKVQWGALTVIKLKNKIEFRRTIYIQIQSSIRTWKCKKDNSFKISCLKRLRNLLDGLKDTNQIVDNLKIHKLEGQTEVNNWKVQFDTLLNKIQLSKITKDEVDEGYEQLMQSMSTLLNKLHKMMKIEKEDEEQRILQEKAKREEEERIRREDKERIEREERIRIENEERIKRENEERIQREHELKRLEEERIRLENEERLRKENEQKQKELEAQIQRETEQRLKIEMESRMHAELEVLQRKEAEERLRLQTERIERENLLKRENEEQQRKLEERIRSEAEQREREKEERLKKELMEKECLLSERLKKETEEREREERRLKDEATEAKMREESERIKRQEMEKMLAALQEKMENERIERLRDEQERIEKERLKREEDERKIKEERELRLRQEEEMRRSIEDEKAKLEEFKKLREMDLALEEQKRKKIEQDKKDRELALRLANEDRSQVEEYDSSRYDYSLPKKNRTVKTPGQRILPLPIGMFNLLQNSTSTDNLSIPQNRHSYTPSDFPSSPNSLNYLNSSFGNEINRSASNNSISLKYTELKKMNFAELRDILNTSCDMELLEECKKELQHRLKAFHEWTSKNENNNIIRAPQSISDVAQNPYIYEQLIKQSIKDSINQQQRFFKMPFNQQMGLNGAQVVNTANSHWWLVHYDGNYIARQMELHPQKPPVLLVAGIDDMKMCELTLPMTGLVKRPNAEISESEFEKVWNLNNGSAYLVNCGKRITSQYLRKKYSI